MFDWNNVVDYVVLAIAFYWVMRWAKDARALRIALGTAGLHAGALLARNYDLVITSWVLDGAALVAVVMLLVVFQPELRRALMRVDSRLHFWPRAGAYLSPEYRAIADAAFVMAKERVGALIVLVGADTVDELIDGGVGIGAEVSESLLRSIFQKTTPLHDGATLIDAGRLVKAGVVLPLTQRQDVPREYGTRHRAAMGLAERTDALVLVVSEERGEVTLMQARSAHRIDSAEEMVNVLQQLRAPRVEKFAPRLKGWLTARLQLKLTAVGLAALFWSMSFLPGSTTVRTATVPVEFSAVPDGLQIASQSASRLDVQIRGSSWLMDSINFSRLVAQFPLDSAKPGVATLRFDPETLDLPPGIEIAQVSPPTITVRLVRVKH